MPWLFIDTTRPDGYRSGLLSPKLLDIRHTSGRARSLLAGLAKRLSRPELSRLDGICVVHGPGSFSAVRSGVIVANLLSRLLQKPLVGVNVEEASNLESLNEKLHQKKHRTSAYVMPTYDAEPNITVPVRSTP